MAVLLLTGLFPKEAESEIFQHSIGSIQNAANGLQWAYVKGFEDVLQEPITILNSVYIGSYPRRYKKIRIDTFHFEEGLDSAKATNIGFLNLSVIKNMSRYKTLKPYVRDWITASKDEKKIIIAYAMTSTFTRLLKYAKRVDENVFACLIVPDLPQYMNLSLNKSIIYRILKYIETKLINEDLRYVDFYILLTQHMINKIKYKRPYIVVEGIASSDHDYGGSKQYENKSSIRTVMYSGGLNEKYGIIELLINFKLLENKDYRLIVCGSGDSEEAIKEASKEDKRIIFKGLLKREEVLALQKESTVLINPRPNNDEFTKYSFPSKLIEYMSSGRPVLAYLLDGIPDEYKNYIYLIKNGGGNSIYDALKEVLDKSDDELSKKGQKAKEFVLRHKNREIQCERIVDEINKIYYKRRLDV